MKTSDLSVLNPAKLLRIYYAATLLFVLLDYFLHINVRLAFLDAWPEMRALYYLLCFVCLGLILWRPNPPAAFGALQWLVRIDLECLGPAVRHINKCQSAPGALELATS
jgi:hypothetical protein